MAAIFLCAACMVKAEPRKNWDGVSISWTSNVSESKAQNLVMTMAAGYPLWRHHRFIGSLRESGFKGDVVVFLDKYSYTNHTIRDYLDGQNVNAMDISSFEVDDSFIEGRPKLLRYHLYATVASYGRYTNSLILLIDFRDALFQTDPFQSVSLNGEWLRFYEEVYPPSLEDSFYTYSWIEECWGKKKAARMAKAVIVCSGATMGTAGGIQHYATKMLGAMKSAPSPQCLTIPHDQRFHNYLLYTNQFERVRLLRAGSAEVFNMGYLGRKDLKTYGRDPIRFHHIDDITVLETGVGLVVLNEDGNKAPVLHQYDRFKALNADIVRRFGGK